MATQKLSLERLHSLAVRYGTRLNCAWPVTFRGLNYANSLQATKRFNSLRFCSTLPKGEKDGRLMIGFTCKKCGNRTHKFMSKKAYEQGVVIIKCPGCDANHLIADHLGWYDTLNKVGTLETMYQKLGRSKEINNSDTGLIELADAKELERIKSKLEKEYPDQ